MGNNPTKNTRWRLDGTVFTDKEDRERYRELRQKAVQYTLGLAPNMTREEYEELQDEMKELERKYFKA